MIHIIHKKFYFLVFVYVKCFTSLIVVCFVLCCKLKTYPKIGRKNANEKQNKTKTSNIFCFWKFVLKNLYNFSSFVNVSHKKKKSKNLNIRDKCCFFDVTFYKQKTSNFYYEIEKKKKKIFVNKYSF